MIAHPDDGAERDLPPHRGTLTRARALADLTWMRVGGPAQWLFQPEDEQDLASFLRNLDADIPVFPIGVGSNLIVRDGGIRGVVVKLGRAFGQISVEGEQMRCGASALDRQLANLAARAGLDMAFLSTIPGTVGGAVRMNAGCYGVCVADMLSEVRVVMRGGAIRTLAASELALSYRRCGLPADAVIIEALFSPRSAPPSDLEAKIAAQRQRRAETQPQGAGTAGSAFRNPSGRPTRGAEDDGNRSAWKLIDAAGLRGARFGGAKLSEMHPNFLVNEGTATAADIEGLGETVRTAVRRHCGIQLEWEIARVGDPPTDGAGQADV